MDLLAISPPDDVYPQEARLIVQLLDAGLQRYHIRKPAGNPTATERLIQAVPDAYHSRLSLHQHYELGDRYAVCFHHTSYTDLGGRSARSCSVHRLSSLETALDGYDYAFLSPIFPSISKAGYGPSWTESSLRAALKPDYPTRLYALGGVQPGKLALAQSLGFEGVVLHGALWQAADPLQVFQSFRVMVA
jgi:thiamine-phosphate pyrophosphorylase